MSAINPNNSLHAQHTTRTDTDKPPITPSSGPKPDTPVTFSSAANNPQLVIPVGPGAKPELHKNPNFDPKKAGEILDRWLNQNGSYVSEIEAGRTFNEVLAKSDPALFSRIISKINSNENQLNAEQQQKAINQVKAIITLDEDSDRIKKQIYKLAKFIAENKTKDTSAAPPTHENIVK